jgi:choline dehydrogenase-like flavoprotein
MADKEYDIIIVGSGAGGGMATYQLANAGLTVALVEAGAVRARVADRLATTMPASAVGISMENPTRRKVILNLCGGAGGCSVGARITGVASP